MADFFSMSPDMSSIGADIGQSLYTLPADIIDAQKVSVAVSGEKPFWKQMVETGISRVIDNAMSRPQVAGAVAPGTAAGQNGGTYQMTDKPSAPTTGAGTLPQVPQAGGAPQGKKTDYTMWIVGAAVVLGGVMLLRGR